jgi:3-oxoacyl-[acyl-carrier-protein] synthase-3
MKAAITATSKFVPQDVLSNHDLEKMIDTNDEWIKTRTGISERRILKDPSKATAYMCGEVAKDILNKRGISAEEIDLIIVGTITPDMVFPATACLVQDIIGAKNAWGFDLSGACSGFLYSLVTAAQFIEAGTHKKILVFGADKMSAITDFTDRTTAILFGDGAGGVLMEPAEEGYGLLDHHMYADGTTGKDHIYMLAGGSLRPSSHETVDQKMHAIRQNGKVVFKSAVVGMADAALEMMEKNNLKGSDVAYLIPHQANHRIISATAERMNIDLSKVGINIDKYGNTTGGTIPICLAELDEAGKLNRGDNLVLVSFGAGYTWGGAYLKWQ